MQGLIDNLNALTPGPIDDITQLAIHLKKCWDEFDGSEQTGTTGGKLPERMEQVIWDPPKLSFELERQVGP